MHRRITDDRRGFLKTAGMAMVAASVPATISGQANTRRPPTQNNLHQLLIAACVAEPNPHLPGIFGLASFNFQMTADINGRSGVATISDPVFTELNSHIEISYGRTDINDLFIFQGTVKRSQSSELIGKTSTIKVRKLPDGNCDVSLTIEDTGLQGLLLPAVQKIRPKIYP